MCEDTSTNVPDLSLETAWEMNQVYVLCRSAFVWKKALNTGGEVVYSFRGERNLGSC